MFTICLFMFYFTSNLMYWLFGFKYWVISIEIPNVIEAAKEGGKQQKRICTETRYKVFNWLGILVNFAVCAVLAWKRGLVDYISAAKRPSSQLLDTCLYLYFAVTFLIFVSAIFLADALRRLKNSFSKDNRLVVN